MFSSLHLSHVTCHVSRVACHMSRDGVVQFNFTNNQNLPNPGVWVECTQWWNYQREGYLSTTRTSLVKVSPPQAHNNTGEIRRSTQGSTTMNYKLYTAHLHVIPRVQSIPCSFRRKVCRHEKVFVGWLY